VLVVVAPVALANLTFYARRAAHSEVVALYSARRVPAPPRLFPVTCSPVLL